MNRLEYAILAVVVLALIGCTVFAVLSLKALAGLPSDAYASDWMAIFVVEHLKSSDDVWPTGWDELRDEYDRMAEPTHYAWTFTELTERVDFRFDVSSDTVRESDPPLVVFRLSSGRIVSYDGDPNLTIRHYLRTGEGGMGSLRRSNE